MTAQEALAAWDAGRPVFTVEMGGLGPGYEQAIQVLVFELLRDDEPLGDDPHRRVPERWGEAAITRCNAGIGGFSGAQVGAARSLAFSMLRDGYEQTLGKVDLDRRIQVSRFWPKPPPAEVRHG